MCSCCLNLQININLFVRGRKSNRDKVEIYKGESSKEEIVLSKWKLFYFNMLKQLMQQFCNGVPTICMG